MVVGLDRKFHSPGVSLVSSVLVYYFEETANYREWLLGSRYTQVSSPYYALSKDLSFLFQKFNTQIKPLCVICTYFFFLRHSAHKPQSYAGQSLPLWLIWNTIQCSFYFFRYNFPKSKTLFNLSSKIRRYRARAVFHTSYQLSTKTSIFTAPGIFWL